MRTRNKAATTTAKATRPRREVCPVQIALEVAHTMADRVGRPLHPIETRWVIQHEFRSRFIGLAPTVANRFADTTIEKIRQMIG